MSEIDDDGWQEQKCRRNKKSKSISESKNSSIIPDNRRRNLSNTINGYHNNVSFEVNVKKEANITVWTKFVMSGDIEQLVKDKVKSLSMDIVGKISTLWDCLYNQLQNCLPQSESFANSNELRNLIMNTTKARDTVVDHGAMGSFCTKFKLQLRISSINNDLNDIFYGSNLAREIRILHIGLDRFLSLEKRPQNSQHTYKFSDEDKELMRGLNTIERKKSEKKIEEEKKILNDIRKMLQGKEKEQDFIPPPEKNSKKKLHYDIYTPEQLDRRNDLIKCRLKLLNAHSGKAIPVENSTRMKYKEIKLNSRRNCGFNAFENDIVYVKINDQESHTGKVMGVFQSSHKPVNSIYICKVSRDQGTLMSPLDKSFSKIHVDNQPGRRQYEVNELKEIQNSRLSIEQKSVLDFERESSKYADNKCYSIFKISINKYTDTLIFNPSAVKEFDPETCEHFFIVCYEYWDPHFMYPCGKIVGILSSHESFNDNFHLITSICSIEPLDNNSRCQKEAKDMIRKSKSISSASGTVLPPGAITFTIDSETTKDMDDAISYHKEGNKTVIGVHISNVTKYVSPTHEIYKQAERRFCTSYPPKFSNITPIHLLNDDLATEVLSLVPDKPRSVISVFFQFSEAMLASNFELKDIISPEFKEGVIVSKYKLNYESVSYWLRQSEKPPDVSEDLFSTLRETYNIAEKIRRARLPRSYFVRSINNYHKDFQIDNQFEAQIIVEEFMILTNEYAAKKIYEKYPNLTLLRMQEPMKATEEWVEKLFKSTNMKFTAILQEYCNLLGVSTNEETKRDLVISRKFYDTFCEYMSKDTEKARNLLQYDVFYNEFFVHIKHWYVLNSPAHYDCSIEGSVENGHFSLNKELYTHFTSPIRRFADIVVHRLLKSVMNNYEIEDNSLDINKVCQIGNKKSKSNKRFEELCAPYAIFEEAEKKSCFILDCVCIEINPEHLGFAHPLLQKAASIKDIKFANLSLDVAPLKIGSETNVNNCTLKWRKIIYSCPPHNEESSKCNKFIIDNHLFDSKLPFSTHKLFQEIRRSYQPVKKLEDKLKELKSKFVCPESASIISSECNSIANPIIDIEQELFIKNTMRIQFCKYKINGLQNIKPELHILTSTFQICLIHQDDPVRFFIPGGKLELKHNDLKKRFNSITEYKEYFEPLIQVESLNEALAEKSEFTLLEVPILWVVGNSPVTKRREKYGVIRLSYEFCKYRNIIFNDERDEIIDRHEYLIEKGISSIGGDLLCLRYDTKKAYWVGHGEIVHVGKWKNDVDSFKVIIFLLTHSNFELDSHDLERQRFTIDVYLKSVVSKRQQQAVASIHNHQLLKDVILGNQILSQKIDEKIINEIQNELESSGIFKFNNNQRKAVTNAMSNKLSLIWGPPGTGKTHIGCILSYVYTTRNNVHGNGGVVLYCGPSNDCVNLVALEMKKRFNEKCPKLLRIFGEQQELADFPLPGFFAKNNTPLTGELQEVSLHYLVRQENNESAKSLKEFDRNFKEILNSPKIARSSENIRKQVHDSILAYRETLKEAKKKLIEKNQYDMVLCTTSVTVTMIMQLFNITQVIIDEAGMCKEPETLIPICAAEATVENVVLIGDHKQLRPIIKNQVANKRGLQISLFERYQELRPKLVTMLNYQYRMHPSICEFPSNEFYRGRLLTQTSNLWSGLGQDDINGYYSQWNGIDYRYARGYYKNILRSSNYNAIPNNLWPTRYEPYHCFPYHDFEYYPERLIFIHVEGDEVNQPVSTATGNENSKGNREEVEVTAYMYEKLIKRIEPPRKSPLFVTVLTQYRLQQHLIETKCTEILTRNKIKQSPLVKTVIRSQGSENDYIIFSTVRSMRNREDIVEYPTPGWEKQYLGFITDANQINVALTRAKKGLIIIGNKHLLSANHIWRRLITDLENRHCVISNYLDFFR